MNKAIQIALVALLTCGVALGTQDTTLSQSDVRNPRTLEAWLEANAADAEARLAILTTSTVGVTPWQNISNAVQQNVSGDITVTDAGVAAIADDAITKAALAAGDFGDVSAGADGTLTLDADVVAAAEMADADHGDISWSSGVASVDDNSLGMTDIAAADYGDISVGADGTVAVDSGAVLASEITSGNLGWARISNAVQSTASGDVTFDAAGAATIAADAIEKASLVAGDFGDFTAAADGTCSLDADVIAADEMADADHGDVSWASGVAAVDSGAVLGSELGAGNIPAANITNALVTLFSADVTVAADGTATIADDAIAKGSLAAGDFGDFTAGADGTCEIDSGVVTTTEILDGTIAAADLATTGDGAVVAAHASCVESAVVMEKRVITLTNCVIITTDGADVGEGTNIWNGAAGAFTVLSAVANLQVVSCAAATTSMKLSVGTALPGEDNDLTGTEADVIPAITFVPDTGGTAADGVLAATVVMDGTAAAKAWYLNLAADNDNLAWNATNTITGTITFFCTPTVDN